MVSLNLIPSIRQLLILSVTLYSKGTVFVITNPITVSFEPEIIRVQAVRYVMDIDAVINDADARNKAFMDILRDHIKGEEKE